MKKFFLFFVCLLLFQQEVSALGVAHTTWSYSIKKLDDKTYSCIITATIAPGWHLYSAKQINTDGAIPLEIKLLPGKGYTLIGTITEQGKLQKEFDKGFEQETYFYTGKVQFIQKVRFDNSLVNIKGTVYGQNCNDEGCQLIDENIEFILTGLNAIPLEATGKSIKIVAIDDTASIAATTVKSGIDSIPETKQSIDTENSIAEINDIDSADVVKDSSQVSANGKGSAGDPCGNGSLWTLFFGGFGAGLLALLTPCVFPIIPLTVSYFTKNSKNGKGLGKSLIFGAAIIVIFVSLGLLVSKVFGYEALNTFSSNSYVNIAFFIIFTIFAISFFGAFDITIPSKWTNNADKQSEKGGLVGIFFIAFTLVLVSFSCTGPIVGNLLVLSANGCTMGPVVGMFSFSFALALPFMLFSAFPSLMKRLPKSGGWLNSVKVVLGFIELALALKFFSNADLTYHWGILRREIFIALWVVIFGLNGMYLLGKLKLGHDTPVAFISVPRLLLAILSLSFALYMLPGMWGAPLNILSGIIPPKGYKEWVTFDKTENKANESKLIRKKDYGIEINHTFDVFFDYEEALAYAKKVNKPLLLDFTGHNCSNCRLMEDNVWTNPKIDKLIRENYVLVSLYYDDRTKLPADEIVILPDGTELNTVSRKVSHFEYERFQTSTQPYYVLLDKEGEKLSEGVGYTPNVDTYEQFLITGIENFKKNNPKK